MHCWLENAAATEQQGRALAQCLDGGAVIYLLGDLGAGKTTFVRGCIQGFGYDGHVRSPTYTLVEPYEVAGRELFHFDLYRLGDPEELEFMGIRDYLHSDAILLVEWPQKGEGMLPHADLVIELQYQREGRELQLAANSERGAEIARCWGAATP